jgi:hypothetical protein
MVDSRRTVATFAELITEEDYTLPSQEDSGAVVLLRKPNVLRLLHEGNVVDFLSPLVEDWIKPTTKQASEQDGMEIVLKLLKAVPELEPRVNTIVQATVQEPKLSSDQVELLSVRDRVAVLLWALGEEFGDLQAMFRRFGKQGQRIQPVGQIPTVGDATESGGGDSK